MMKVIKAKNYQQMSRKAANIISAQIILKPSSVIGLATGSSPIGTYKQLIDWYNKGDLNFKECYGVNLDEYVGLNSADTQSYAYFMRENFYKHININYNNVFIPDGTCLDDFEECERYNSIIK